MQGAFGAVGDLTPQTGIAWRWSLLFASQPTHEARTAQGIGDGHRDQRKATTDEQTGQRMLIASADHPPERAASRHHQQPDRKAWPQPDHRRPRRRRTWTNSSQAEIGCC